MRIRASASSSVCRFGVSINSQHLDAPVRDEASPPAIRFSAFLAVPVRRWGLKSRSAPSQALRTLYHVGTFPGAAEIIGVSQRRDGSIRRWPDISGSGACATSVCEGISLSIPVQKQLVRRKDDLWIILANTFRKSLHSSIAVRSGKAGMLQASFFRGWRHCLALSDDRPSLGRRRFRCVFDLGRSGFRAWPSATPILVPCAQT